MLLSGKNSILYSSIHLLLSISISGNSNTTYITIRPHINDCNLAVVQSTKLLVRATFCFTPNVIELERTRRGFERNEQIFNLYSFLFHDRYDRCGKQFPETIAQAADTRLLPSLEPK
jgi:hypothetical protein